MMKLRPNFMFIWFYGVSTPVGLFKAKIFLFYKQLYGFNQLLLPLQLLLRIMILIYNQFSLQVTIFYTNNLFIYIYDFKYSNLILVIFNISIDGILTGMDLGELVTRR